jgi:hypothetical protein
VCRNNRYWCAETTGTGVQKQQVLVCRNNRYCCAETTGTGVQKQRVLVCRNNRYWCAENCMLIREDPLHGGKSGVWCAVSATSIIGPFYFYSWDQKFSPVWHEFLTRFLFITSHFFSKITYTTMNAMYYVFGDNTERVTVATFTRSIPMPFLFVKYVEGHSSYLLLCIAFKRNYRHFTGM